MDEDRGGAILAYYRKVAPFLERECAGRGDGDFWKGVAREAGGDSILEIGAGTGRITEILAQGAEEVVALDISPEMLERARQRVGGRSRVHLVEADMTSVRFGQTFDWVVAANDPLVHLLDDRERDAVFATIGAHLEIGGRFVVDGLWFPPRKRETAASSGGFVRERKACEGDDLVVHQEWTAEPEHPFYRARFEYRWEGTLLTDALFRARVWEAGEMGRRMAMHGLAPASRWGGYGREPFEPGSSDRLLVEARKVEPPDLP